MRKLEDDFDKAILGVASCWSGDRSRKAVVYSGDKMVKIVAKRDGIDEEDAFEIVESGEGAHGPDSPLIVWKEPDIDDLIASIERTDH